MENDKLKELLMQYAENSTSAGFTSRVMKQVEATTPAWQSKPLVKQKLPKAIALLFAVICVASIAVSFFLKPIELPLYNTPSWLALHSWQIVYFLFTFWTVLLLNQWWNKKKAISYSI